MNTPILWIEIPVAQMPRAVMFYENLLNTSLQLKTLFDMPMAVFNKEIFGIKASLVQVKNFTGSNGIKPFIKIPIMSDAMAKVIKFGGKIISEPTLLRQKNKNGETIIGTNLIDGEVGYYAQIQDSEGNHCYLYSHS